MMLRPLALLLAALLRGAVAAEPYVPAFAYDEAAPKLHSVSARASVIDPRAKSHPKINFLLEKDGKAQDMQLAVVDTRVKPRGKLVIWLMGGGADLFAKTASYGLHAIRVHYANGWFGNFNDGTPKDTWRGDIRLEASIGEDVSPLIDIPKPDGMTERSVQFVKWLAKNHPQGKWSHFLNKDGTDLNWEDVIVAGISHGSTTAARFAMHRKVGRVVCFSGPRDQDQSWQAGPSATPANRYFCFTHVLDAGWVGKHYCRSWELLGLLKFGPVTDVEKVKSPYGNSRQLTTAVPGKGQGQFHSGVIPGGGAFKGADGKFLHEDVWRYVFTHPVDQVGQPAAVDPNCRKP